MRFLEYNCIKDFVFINNFLQLYSNGGFINMQNYEIRAMARKQLQGKWGLALGTFLLIQIILVGITYVGAFIEILSDVQWIAYIITIPFTPVFTLGKCRFALNLATDKNTANLEDIFSQFNLFFKALGLFILQTIIIYVGLILLIVPGIILSFSLSQSYYVLVENPDKSIIDCLKESNAIMKGYKWKLFCLYFSFIGWSLLTVLTCGIGTLWLTPYMEISMACFYKDITRSNNSYDII